MRKVHIVKGRVVYVYWIDTVYEQNYQLNEVKGQYFVTNGLLKGSLLVLIISLYNKRAH